jgi:NodT family efflux transporter outer membrane factor (OMF) lipoprotein
MQVPEEWAAADTSGPTEGADDLWWMRFEDELLNTIVGEALANNFTLKGAVARVDAAAAIARIAGADLVPNASLNANGSRRRQNLIGIPIPGAPGVISTRSTSLGVSLDVLWEIDLWGRIRSGKSGALADLQASWADLAAFRLSVAAQSVKAYFAAIEARMQVDLAEESVESYRLSAEQVRSRYERGVRSSLDLRLALSALAGAEALRELRREQFDRTRRQLEILLARYPSGTIEAHHALPTLASAVPPGLPSELLIRRPDVLAAERRYAASEKRVSQARRAFFPRITLTASGGTLSEQLKDLIDGDFSVWSIAAGLTQPIFQGGRLRGSLAQSHALADIDLADYASAMLAAFGEVETALFSEKTLANREAHLAEAADQAEAARQLAEREYSAGLIDYITVLETQRRALGSRSGLIAVRRQRLDAQVNLHVALGGGFDLNKEWTQFLGSHSGSETEGSSE